MINLLIALFLLKIRTFNMTTLDTKIFNQAMDAPFEQLDKVVSYIDDKSLLKSKQVFISKTS